VTVASYGKQVTARYADKQPGSAYAAQGTAGGYGAASAAVNQVPAGSDDSSGVDWLVLASGTGATALCGGALILRRRRRALV